MRLWFEVNQHKERSIRTFNEKGSEVEIIICQVISITARLIVPSTSATWFCQTFMAQGKKI